jgi:hypothetical protein
MTLMKFSSRLAVSIACSISLCVIGLYSLPGAGEMILLPGYRALGAKYVFGGPVLLMAIPLDGLIYAAAIFALLTITHKLSRGHAEAP